MSTTSKAIIPKDGDQICQGDIFRDVKYCYIDAEDNEHVEIIEMTFPYAIIISQACDVIAMDSLLKTKQGKATKYMPSVLMCPIYAEADAKSGDHLIDTFQEFDIQIEKENIIKNDDLKVARRDWHYRYHPFEVEVNNQIMFEKTMIDFKHYFTVSMSYLLNNISNRMLHLEDLFSEQITLKFATYLSRVAIP